MAEKKFMRKVCVTPDVDIQMMHVWVEDQGNDKATLKLAEEAIKEDSRTLLEDAEISVHASFTKCADDKMDDQAVTKNRGWIHVSDLTDDEGNKVEPSSDPRVRNPDAIDYAGLEKVGQQRLPCMEDEEDGD